MGTGLKRDRTLGLLSNLIHTCVLVQRRAPNRLSLTLKEESMLPGGYCCRLPRIWLRSYVWLQSLKYHYANMGPMQLSGFPGNA